MEDFHTTYREKLVVLRCSHKKEFPPTEGVTRKDMDEAWKSGRLRFQEYERYKIWERVCGLREMGKKCLSCPHALKMGQHPTNPNQSEVLIWVNHKD